MAEYLLDDEVEEFQLVPASREKRILNFVLDYLAIIFMVSAFYGFFLDLDSLTEENRDPLMDNIRGMLFYLSYYIAVEGMSGGRSFGKMITKTRVVNREGVVPEAPQMIKRSLIRLVPFEPLSALGELAPWHDRWSDTMVVDETLSKLPD